MLLAIKHISRVFMNYHYDKIILIPLFMIKEDSGMFRSYSWLWWFDFKAVLSNGTFWDDENGAISAIQYNSCLSHMRLLSSWNMASMTEELNLKFLILNNLNINSHMRLVVVLANTVQQWER